MNEKTYFTTPSIHVSRVFDTKLDSLIDTIGVESLFEDVGAMTDVYTDANINHRSIIHAYLGHK